ncbi:hypothetical protein N752_11480 [Desulforamulus aquiferis]|nr:hypothetical protein N752_11480 [Desulforamulus aquiferis]
MINPVQQPVRQLSREVFYQTIKLAPKIDQQLQLTSQIIMEKFIPQVQGEEGKAHLFIYINGERNALYFRKGLFCSREGSMAWTPDELAGLAMNKPEMFSPMLCLGQLFRKH